MLKFEKLLPGCKAQYSDTINGRRVYATTVNGSTGAARIFEIMKLTGGVGKSPAVRMDTAKQ